MMRESFYRAVSSETMREIDARTIHDAGLPGIALMENAGREVARIAVDLSSQLQRKEFLVVCGKGNNAGDGFVVARWLRNAGYEVQVFLLYEDTAYHGDAATNLRVIRSMDVAVHTLTPEDMPFFTETLQKTGVVIDAIFGTGFHGTIALPVTDVIEAMNTSQRMIIAIDVPSGLQIHNDALAGSCVKAHVTVTLALPKAYLSHPAAKDIVGKVMVVDIGIPENIIRDMTQFKD